MPQSISSFYLDNEGGFVCYPSCDYIDLDTGGTGDGDNGGNLSLGMTEYYDPGNNGVPAGALVQLHINIKAGDDRTGGSYFVYDPNAGVSARYEITGTTYNSSVDFNGVS